MLTVARDKEKTLIFEKLYKRPSKRFIEEIDLENETKTIETSSIVLNINIE